MDDGGPLTVRGPAKAEGSPSIWSRAGQPADLEASAPGPTRVDDALERLREDLTLSRRERARRDRPLTATRAPASPTRRIRPPRGRTTVLRILTVAIVAVLVGGVIGVAGAVGDKGHALSTVGLVSAVPDKTLKARTARISTDVRLAGVEITVDGVIDLAHQQGTFTSNAPGIGTIEVIQDGATVYDKLPPSAASGFGGKQWLKFNPATLLAKATGVNAGVFSQGASADPTAVLGSLRGASDDFHQVGREAVRGEPTTHYQGTLDLNKAAANTPSPNRRSGLQQLAKAIGTPSFTVDLWADRAGRLRRLQYRLDLSKFDLPGIVSPQGIAIYSFEMYGFGTAFTMPAIPPADQVTDLAQVTATPATPPSTGRDLASAVVGPPAGFAASNGSGVHNGPLDAAAFDKSVGSASAAAKLGFTGGYDVTYDRRIGSDTVEITLLEFDSADRAANFRQIADQPSVANGLVASAVSGIPAANAYDATTAGRDGTYEHSVVALKANRVMVVDYIASAPGPVPLVGSLATQQYVRL
jgi:hypothetical protein